MAITRTPMIDDDGTGTTGTIINSAWKVELYDQIDAALTGVTPPPPYTTGTWLPRVEGDGAAATGQSYVVQEGIYLRMGQLVMFTATVILTNKGTINGGNVVIRGLPAVAMAANAAGVVHVGFFAGLTMNAVSISGLVPLNSTQISLYYTAAPALGVSNMPVSILSNNTDLRLSGQYWTP